jgi:hypothetical protein
MSLFSDLIFGMLDFLTRKRPEPTPEETTPWEQLRKSELETLLANLDLGLEVVTREQREFRLQHCTFNGAAVVYVSDSPFSRVELESRWRSLCARRDAIYKLRNETLAELAAITIKE